MAVISNTRTKEGRGNTTENSHLAMIVSKMNRNVF